MDVSATSPVTTNGTNTQQSSAAKNNTVDYNAFLQLLIAQLKNQDPTNPTDSAQYIAQLASFSGVEQSVKMNAKLDAILSTAALSQAESVIGRTVTSFDGTVSGTAVALQVFSDGAVVLLDSGEQLALGPGVIVS